MELRKENLTSVVRSRAWWSDGQRWQLDGGTGGSSLWKNLSVEMRTSGQLPLIPLEDWWKIRSIRQRCIWISQVVEKLKSQRFDSVNAISRLVDKQPAHELGTICGDLVANFLLKADSGDLLEIKTSGWMKLDEFFLRRCA